MRDVLIHRGPDGAGEYDFTLRPGLSGWFGHRRLKVVDVSEAAHQPMTTADGLIALNYNGEVYNFRSLRRDLQARGHKFESSGDTEVVLRAYEEWGDNFVTRLDGMFAIAVWDGRAEKLLLARDRVGKKPLYYYENESGLTYASEIKALLAAPWITPRVDEKRVPEFLLWGYVPYPRTLYEGIVQVPPASVVVYDRNGLHEATTYWDAAVAEDHAAYDKDAPGVIARLVREATERRMIADVPLGALLSGGIDSSVVVGLMCRASRQPIHTFSIGFPDEPSFDERGHARLVADHFRTAHTEFSVRVDAVGLMDVLLWHHDQPYGDSSAIPTYLVSRLAREHVTVVLNGDGGDEVFGGYDRFTAARLSEFLPTSIIRLAGHATRFLPAGDSYYNARRRFERFTEVAAASPVDRYLSWVTLFNEATLCELVSEDLSSEVSEAPSSFYTHYDKNGRARLLDRLLYVNLKTYLPDDLAVKMDRMAMAHSLEPRSPFLDPTLINYVGRIPAQNKIGMRQLKPLLRKAFGDLLPDVVWRRKKHGFGVPLNAWFRGELGVMFEDEVLGPGAKATENLLRRDAIEKLWREHRSAQASHGYRLWSLLVLEHWLRRTPQRISSRPREPTTLAA